MRTKKELDIKCPTPVPLIVRIRKLAKVDI
jgi:hypothetical protein